MSDTPMTDAVENTPSFNTYNKMLKHAHRMERDRARLVKALQWYAKAHAFSLQADAGFMARQAIAEVEKHESDA